jgi:hypothetical protein
VAESKLDGGDQDVLAGSDNGSRKQSNSRVQSTARPNGEQGYLGNITLRQRDGVLRPEGRRGDQRTNKVIQ